MAADLHIHILKAPCTENVLARFNCHTLGSKHFDLHGRGPQPDDFSIVSDTPNIHIGEVSWLKAALTGDSETFVPHIVENVSRVIGEDLPVIDDDLIEKLKAAYRTGNQTDYDVGGENAVIDFLAQHKGERAFTVSW